MISCDSLQQLESNIIIAVAYDGQDCSGLTLKAEPNDVFYTLTFELYCLHISKQFFPVYSDGGKLARNEHEPLCLSFESCSILKQNVD